MFLILESGKQVVRKASWLKQLKYQRSYIRPVLKFWINWPAEHTLYESGFHFFYDHKQFWCVASQSAREEGSSTQGGFRKLDMEIPQRFMGQVIGKGREKLSNIETKSGVALKVIESDLYIKGSTEQEKKVIREIKAITVRWFNNRSSQIKSINVWRECPFVPSDRHNLYWPKQTFIKRLLVNR